MDFLSRLIAGSGATSSAKQRANAPTERLASCKKLCNALQSIWRNGASLTEVDAASSHVASLLGRLNAILTDESRRAAPHSCLAYTASSQIYIIIAKLALTSTSGEIIDASTYFFHLLINGEAEGVVDSKIFARSLVDLVRRFTGPAGFKDGEAALIELLFEIATKIRLDPDILPAWFYPERRPGQSQASSGESRRGQFPMFYVLVEYVHYDGPTGDFARTSLLYLTETASRSRALEQWMMESDLAPQMASGLSALYSRLSRHSLEFGKDSLPILAYSDRNGETDQSIEDDLDTMQQNIRAFLSYLAFWQDTLNHCKSVEVRDTLLDHFQVLFVQQLLYPSLLESSDVAGGSTAAVILHLCRIMEAIEYQPLIQRMLQYLFAAHGTGAGKPAFKRDRSRMSISRRKSMELLDLHAQQLDNPSPDLFNLLDLIVFSLRSKHVQTVTSSLRLITVLLHRHHHHIRREIFESRSPTSVELHQNLNDLNNTMMTLFDLANSISQVASLDQSYQAALTDGQILLERHSCLLQSAQDPISREHTTVAIAPNCKVFTALSDLLANWFGNDTLVNLELTGAFVALAACEHMLLRAWLATTLNTLETLVSYINQWRKEFVEWDAFYTTQRVDLAGEEEAGHAQPKSPALESQRSPHSPTLAATSPKLSPKLGAKKAGPLEIGSIGSRIAQSPRASPLQHSLLPGDDSSNQSPKRNISDTPTVSSTLLETQIPLPVSQDFSTLNLPLSVKGRLKLEHPGSGTESPDGGSGTVTPSIQPRESTRTSATLRHILTQAVMLQEFILELAAMLQIRATLFDEVDLS